MKYLLGSKGFTTPEIVQACEDLVGKSKSEISFAIINEASTVEMPSKRWIIDECKTILDNFGGNIDFVNLLALSPDEVRERLDAQDAIYVLGGDSDYLMSVYNKTGFDEILQSLEDDKVYVGSSAGSMVVGKRMSSVAYQEIYGEENNYGISQYLNAVDFCFIAHLNNPAFNARTPQLMKKSAQYFDGDTYCLEDTQAIAVDGDHVRYLGGEPLKMSAL